MKFSNGFSMGFKWVHSNGESSKTSAVLAAYHHPNSITWRWALYWNKHYRLTFKILSWCRYPDGHGSATLTLPFIGGLTLSTQAHMFRNNRQ